MNTAASTLTGQVLNQVLDNLNSNVRTQLLEEFNKQRINLTVVQASSLATTIKKNVINVNEIDMNSANGNTPVYLFPPLWMAIMVSTAIIFVAVSKMPIKSRMEKFEIKIVRILMGAIVALIVGLGFTWIADGMVGLDIPDTALFLTITAFSFFLMISAVLSFLGIKGVPVFALLLLFGSPLIAMAPEMMSSLYRDWIYSWLPM